MRENKLEKEIDKGKSKNQRHVEAITNPRVYFHFKVIGTRGVEKG